MSKNEDDILSKLNAPWITKDGYLDWAKFPIDSTLKQALSLKYDEFQSACRTLASMSSSGRTEASIFLFGLLIHNADNIIPKSCKREYNAARTYLNAESDGPGRNFSAVLQR